MNRNILLLMCTLLFCVSCEAGKDSPAEERFDDWVSSQQMLERSLLSLGNTYRIKKVLAKVARNEDVTIAYIGGSITEGYTQKPEDAYTDGGGSYAVGSFEKFKARFAGGDGDHLHYVNAGMGGTPSTLGMMRYEPEVLANAPTPPDLVIVEFAVNDNDDVTNGAAYESLVRKILQADNAPAVILLFSVFKSEWNLEDRLVPVGTAYQLPMVSVKQAVVPEFNAGTLTKDDFFRDDYHPRGIGFEIMAETLDYYFYKVSMAPADAVDAPLPEDAVIGYQFADIQTITPTSSNAGVSVNVGSFTDKDPVLPTYGWSLGIRKTEENFYKSDVTSNTPFTVSGTIKNLVLSYKVSTSENFGVAEAYIDGEFIKRFSGKESDAWNQPKTIVLLDDESAASHTLEIKMSESVPVLDSTNRQVIDESGNVVTESHADKNFTIIMIGYTL
ncbi:MAG: SGNH/GDSL hydrolase family protein [Deltaproteobacteria bacterium]|nr:SGNH/GDSL hydrolase family protein [Deltaproteobacteria bacterium]